MTDHFLTISRSYHVVLVAVTIIAATFTPPAAGQSGAFSAMVPVPSARPVVAARLLGSGEWDVGGPARASVTPVVAQAATSITWASGLPPSPSVPAAIVAAADWHGLAVLARTGIPVSAATLQLNQTAWAARIAGREQVPTVAAKLIGNTPSAWPSPLGP